MLDVRSLEERQDYDVCNFRQGVCPMIKALVYEYLPIYPTFENQVFPFSQI